MAEKNAPENERKRGRTKLWAERLHLTLPEGAKERMDAVLREDEDRLDLIREAIDREIKRRLRERSKPGPSSSD